MPRHLFKAIFAALALAFTSHAQECNLVIEAYSGKVLTAENSSVKRPIASLTAIATAVVAIDWATAADQNIANVTITVPDTVSLVGGPNPLNLQPGDTLTLRDALYAALLTSDPMASITIADHVGRELNQARGKNADPVVTFVAEMNRLAKALGLNNTRFANPHGIERKGAKLYSTAADVAKLSIYAMRRNAFNYIVRQSSRTIAISSASGKRSRNLTNTNRLLGKQNITGIKEGSSEYAGSCIAVCSDLKPLVRTKPDGSKGATPRRLIAVCLGSPDAATRAASLTKQGWSIYDSWLAAGAPVKDRKREIITLPIK